MLTATLTDKGQVTLPKALRAALRLKTGEKIRFVIRDGEAVLKPALRSVDSVIGLLRQSGQSPVSIDEMNAAIRKRAMEFKQ